MLKYTKAKQKKIKRVWVRVGRGEIWGGGVALDPPLYYLCHVQLEYLSIY